MPIWRGTYWRVIFQLQDQNGAPLNPIYDWQFRAQFREDLDDEPPLLDLSSANGGFVVVDSRKGRFAMQITAEQSKPLPDAMLYFDVLRTDTVPAPVRLFGGRVPSKTPVTRYE